MGAVNEIYLSKLSEVQQKLQTVASRTGVKPPTFYQALQEAQSAYSAEASSSVVVEDTGTAQLSVSARANEYDSIVQQAATTYGLSANMIKAVIQAESSFREDVVSASGAEGLMQLKPGTAAGLGVTNSFDPTQNILAGTAYLKKQLDRFGDMRLALAAYNTGPNAIEEMAGDGSGGYDYNKLTAEERRYVDKVYAYYNTFVATDVITSMSASAAASMATDAVTSMAMDAISSLSIT